MNNLIDKTISKIKLAVIIPDEPPEAYLRKWRDSMKKIAPQMLKNIKQVISGRGDYAKKIANPAIQEFINWLNQDYRSKKRMTYKQIIDKMMLNIPAGYNKYIKKTKRAFESVKGKKAKRFHEVIDACAYKVALRGTQLVLPFTGYKDIIRGIGPFAARWLTGDLLHSSKKRKDKPLKKLICNSDKIIRGGPILITTIDKVSEFRNKFNSRIRRAGSQIVNYNYSPGIIERENAFTNELVNQYIKPDIAPFTPNGSSHVDYILDHNDLWLEIQVTQI